MIRPRAAVLWVLAMVLTTDAVDGREDTRQQVVRSSTPLLVSAIDKGFARSATVRRLVNEVKAAHGIVLLEGGQCQRRAQSCLLHRITVAGDHRILFAEFDLQQRRPTLIAAIAHELQHAVEVLANRDIRTGKGMYLFYQRDASQLHFETPAARRTTIDVEAELEQTESSAPRALFAMTRRQGDR